MPPEWNDANSQSHRKGSTESETTICEDDGDGVGVHLFSRHSANISVPLLSLSSLGWPTVLESLLAHPSTQLDVPCPLYDNDSPLQLAERFHFSEGVQMLKERMANAL